MEISQGTVVESIYDVENFNSHRFKWDEAREEHVPTAQSPAENSRQSSFLRLPRELEKGRKETNKTLQPQQILALHDMRIPTTWLWSDV